MMRVTLLYDRAAWVLHEIARQLQQRLASPRSSLDVRIAAAPKDAEGLRALERDSDVVHFLSPWDYYRLWMYVQVPCVVTIHHLVSHNRLAQTHDRADAICVAHAPWLEPLRRAHPRLHDRLYSTQVGVDTEFFRPIPGARDALRRRLGCNAETVIVGCSMKQGSDEGGRKGIDRLWNVTERLQASTTPVRLVISGPDWSSSDVPEPLQSTVQLMGFLQDEYRPEFFSGLDYYMCLSRVEGGPYPVMESMACETTVISTPVGMVSKLVHDAQTGFLVTESNYLERILELVSSWRVDDESGRQLRRQARNAVQQTVSWERCVDPARYEQIYEAARHRWSRERQRLLAIADREIRTGWTWQLATALQEIASLVPEHTPLVLADEEQLAVGRTLGQRRVFPFVEHRGAYWGPPANDQVAISELERLREHGARFLVVAWPAFWWLQHYTGLRRHLRERYRCRLENERVIIFSLYEHGESSR